MEVNGDTKLFALLGHPVGHSFSPKIHNPNLEHNGVNGIYMAFDVLPENLESAVNGLFALGAEGANVTVPHKEKVIKYLCGISEEADLIGAVNTLVRTEDGFWGENTDGRGFLRSLEVFKKFSPENKKVLILGAGGSARAVSVALALAGAEEICFVNRNQGKAEKISELLKEKIGCKSSVYKYEDVVDLEKVLAEAELIINTTVLGMYPNVGDKPLLNYDSFHKGQLAVDLIYNPEETVFLRQASLRGADTLNGYGMLYCQAELAFFSWTGKYFKR